MGWRLWHLLNVTAGGVECPSSTSAAAAAILAKTKLARCWAALRL
eukprot:COSAG01_NODE_24017_length_793_cov_2.495677_1_plen_44_part_10